MGCCFAYLQDDRNGSLTKNDEAPWMVGALSRQDCERLMLRSGREKDFVIRSRTVSTDIDLVRFVRVTVNICKK